MKYKISEIGKVVGGGTPSTKHNEYYSKNGLAWITPKDLSDYHKKYIGHGAKDISEEGLKHSSAKLLPINSILISSRAPIGYVAMAGTDLATSQGFKSIIPDASKILPDYLYYLMLRSKNKLERIASGSTFKEVSGREMSNFVVDIPELKIQKEIVQKLNPISKEIEKNNLINDNLVFQKYLFIKMFFKLFTLLFIGLKIKLEKSIFNTLQGFVLFSKLYYKFVKQNIFFYIIFKKFICSNIWKFYIQYIFIIKIFYTSCPIFIIKK